MIKKRAEILVFMGLLLSLFLVNITYAGPFINVDGDASDYGPVLVTYGPGCPSLSLDVKFPVESSWTDLSSTGSASCSTSNPQACGNNMITHIESGSPFQKSWYSFSALCQLSYQNNNGGHEGYYGFRVEDTSGTGEPTEATAPSSVLVEWNDAEDWCDGGYGNQCGYGDWNPSGTTGGGTWSAADPTIAWYVVYCPSYCPSYPTSTYCATYCVYSGGGGDKCCSPREMDPNMKALDYTNEDCTAVSGNNLCYFPERWDDPDSSKSHGGDWIDYTEVKGEIIYEGCSEIDDGDDKGREYLADDNKWVYCASSGFTGGIGLGPVTVTGKDSNDADMTHGFACLNWRAPHLYSIAECNVRDNDDLNRNQDSHEQINYGGLISHGGESVNISISGDTSHSRVYFCNNESKWAIDLDDSQKAGDQGEWCEKAKLPVTSFSSSRSTSSGDDLETEWTGNYCCGEPDDWSGKYPDNRNTFTVDNEYYNDPDDIGSNTYDPDEPGACFNNWHQDNQSFLKIYKDDGEKGRDRDDPKELKEVMVAHGRFEGCALITEDAMPADIVCAPSRTNDVHKPYEGTLNGTDLNNIDYGYNNVGVSSHGGSGTRYNDFLFDDFFNAPGEDQPNSGTGLINDNDYCTIMNWTNTGQAWYCSYKEVWTEDTDVTSGMLPRTHLSFIPWDNESAQQAECCRPTQCWDGSACIDTVLVSPFNVDPPHKIMNDRGKDYGDNSLGDGFICKDGDWEWSYVKPSWDGTEAGYCLNNTQCFVGSGGEYSLSNKFGPLSYEWDEIGSTNQPKCINNNEFYIDHYCDDGSWTTRTKYVALELFDIAKNSNKDYTLYCDNYEKVLNNADYAEVVNGFSPISEKFFVTDPASGCQIWNEQNVPCANHMCVLVIEPSSSNQKIYLGTSINYPLATTTDSGNPISTYELGEAMGTSLRTCSGAQGVQDSWSNCGTDLSFHGKKSLVLFSRETIDQGSFFAAMTNFFTDVVQRLINWIVRIVTNTSGYNYALMEDLGDDLFHDYGGESYQTPDFECDLNGGCLDDPLDGSVPTNVCGERSNPRKMYDMSTLYVSSIGARTIYGMAEYEADNSQTLTRLYGLMFEGFDEDVCSVFKPSIINYRCESKGGGTYAVTVAAKTPSIGDISYNSIVDLASYTWEQWRFLATSSRLQDISSGASGVTVESGSGSGSGSGTSGLPAGSACTDGADCERGYCGFQGTCFDNYDYCNSMYSGDPSCYHGDCCSHTQLCCGI